MGKSTPAAPDYTGAAQQQAASSRDVTEQQTWANRPTINTPFGQQTWSNTPTFDPTTGQYLNQWTQNTNLTPEAQQALDSQMGLQQGRSDLAAGLLGRAQQEYGQPMDWSQFDQLAETPNQNLTDYGQGPDQANLQKNIGNTGDYYNKAGDAIFNQWSARNEPQFQKDQDRMRTQLLNQGLREGDEAYKDAMNTQSQQQGDARNNASYQATIGAGQEASRMQGMDVNSGNFANQAAQQAFSNQLTGSQYSDTQRAQQGQEGLQFANYQNQLRQQQIAEQMQQRGFSLNEINAILSGQQVGMPNMPSFNTAARSDATQYSNAAQQTGQHDLDVFNAQQQASQGLMSGVAGGAMMFSDKRLKKDVTRVGKVGNIPLYVWRWIFGGVSIGVLSEDVRHIPRAVTTDPNSGYDMVDYKVIYG